MNVQPNNFLNYCFCEGLQHVGGVFCIAPPIKTEHHDISEILLKVALNILTECSNGSTHNLPHFFFPDTSQTL